MTSIKWNGLLRVLFLGATSNNTNKESLCLTTLRLTAAVY